jgi:hypothetical protein
MQHEPEQLNSGGGKNADLMRQVYELMAQQDEFLKKNWQKLLPEEIWQYNLRQKQIKDLILTISKRIDRTLAHPSLVAANCAPIFVRSFSCDHSFKSTCCTFSIACPKKRSPSRRNFSTESVAKNCNRGSRRRSSAAPVEGTNRSSCEATARAGTRPSPRCSRAPEPPGAAAA